VVRRPFEWRKGSRGLLNAQGVEQSIVGALVILKILSITEMTDSVIRDTSLSGRCLLESLVADGIRHPACGIRSRPRRLSAGGGRGRGHGCCGDLGCTAVRPVRVG
jgi:hypothetical protein